MSRLADYFVVVGYDHEKERKYIMHVSKSLYGKAANNSAVPDVGRRRKHPVPYSGHYQVPE